MTDKKLTGTVVRREVDFWVVEVDESTYLNVAARHAEEVDVGDRVELTYTLQPSTGEWRVSRVLPARPFGGHGELRLHWGEYTEE